MHRAGILRGIFVLILLENGKRIHVGANGNDPAAFANLCDDAGFSHAALDPISHLLQFIRNDLRRALKLEADLRVHMKVTPPFDQFL
jgi:hypothetical protein